MGSFTELDMREKSEVATAEWFKPIMQQVVACADEVLQFLTNIQAKMQQAKKRRHDDEYMEGISFVTYLATTRCKKWLRTRRDSRCFDSDDLDAYDEFERLVVERREERIVENMAKRLAAQNAAATEEVAKKNLSDADIVMIHALVQEMVENAQKICASKAQPEGLTLDEYADEALRPLPTFVEIRQMVKEAKMSSEEAAELCNRLVDTMYPNGSSSNHRHLNEIDEVRLLELAEDYAQAAENEDVTFLCKYIRSSKESLLARETVFVNLVLRNADPADVKKMVIRAFICELVKRDKREMAMRPRICCRKIA